MTPENKLKAEFVPDRDGLSFIVSLLIGDGHLADKGALRIDHGLQQGDYADWIAERLSKIVKQEIVAKQYRNAKCISVQRKFLADLKPKIYDNIKREKRIHAMLGYSTNPLETVAIWVCDDGSVVPSVNQKYGKMYGYAIQIFTFTDLEESVLLADWFEKHIGLRPKLVFMDRSKSGRKSAYKLKFTAKDSRKLFDLTENYIPNIKSMNFKFRCAVEYKLSKSPRQK